MGVVHEKVSELRRFHFLHGDRTGATVPTNLLLLFHVVRQAEMVQGRGRAGRLERVGERGRSGAGRQCPSGAVPPGVLDEANGGSVGIDFVGGKRSAAKQRHAAPIHPQQRTLLLNAVAVVVLVGGVGRGSAGWRGALLVFLVHCLFRFVPPGMRQGLVVLVRGRGAAGGGGGGCVLVALVLLLPSTEQQVQHAGGPCVEEQARTRRSRPDDEVGGQDDVFRIHVKEFRKWVVCCFVVGKVVVVVGGGEEREGGWLKK